MRRHFVLTSILLVALPAPAASIGDPAIQVQTVATGLTAPSGMAFIGDDDILVLEQLDGRVRRILHGVLLPDPVLDLPVDNVLLDRGLLGIAPDPDFANRPFVYLFYVEADVDGGTTIATRVRRFRWDGSALVDPFLLLTLPAPPSAFRIGGIVLFGRDDMLYTVIGDLQFRGKLQNMAGGPNPNDTSVIFRTRSDGSVPTDNPFYVSATGTLELMNRYYAYGIRNSFGMAVDPVTGALWDTENGQSLYDEVNRVLPGMNSGWTRIQGPIARGTGQLSDLWMVPNAAYHDPQLSWFSPVAPTSIAFTVNPRLGCGRTHDVLVAAANCGLLYHLPVNAQRTGFDFSSPALADLVVDNTDATQCSAEQAEILFGTDFGVVGDIETGPDGNVYLTSLDQGTVSRLLTARSASVDADQDGVEDTCDCNAGDVGAWTAPGEVARLRVSGGAPTRLGWDDFRSSLGSGARASLVSGRLSDLRGSHGYSGSCTLASMLEARAWTDLRPLPPAGDGDYYLVRVGDSCGPGTFGNSGLAPDPREVLDGSPPGLCP